MTDVNNVISNLNTGSLLSVSNNLKAPEGDRIVFYNRSGFLDTDYPPVMSAVKEATITNISTLRLNSHAPILTSAAAGYFAVTGTLDPAAVDPRRLIIKVAGQADAAQILTLPTPGTLVRYLKSYYGPENVPAGLCWELRFLNDNGAGFAITIQAPTATAPEIATNYGFGATTPLQRTVNAKTTTTFLFLILSTTPGSEAVAYYAL